MVGGGGMGVKVALGREPEKEQERPELARQRKLRPVSSQGWEIELLALLNTYKLYAVL